MDALIGLFGGIIVTLISGVISLYLARKQKHFEQLHEEKKQKKQNQLNDAQILRENINRAKTTEDRIRMYCQSLHKDPLVSRLQILDMSRPIEVTHIYVRVRVHQNVRLRYKLEKELVDAEITRSPLAILEAGFHRIEHITSGAILPDEALRRYKHCVFVGDPGAGKTTLLRYLTLKSADKMLPGLPHLPIYIELNAFANSHYEYLLDFTSHLWEERYGFPSTDALLYLEKSFTIGNVVLLLDALDEAVLGESDIEAEKTYQRVVTAITKIAIRYPASYIAVTVRKAGYQQRSPLRGFTELEVAEFRRDDINLFIRNWFAYYHDTKKLANAIDLTKKLEHNPRIQTLATNPLLLSLIVLVYEAQLDLPERRSELYKRCIDTLLAEWDAKRDIHRRRGFKVEHKKQLLAEIAWVFHFQGKRYFPESELLTIITNFMPKVGLRPSDNQRILAEIANENSLLKEMARGWHGFLHLTIQEYFVVQFAADHGQLETLLAHYNDPWWEEVILLYAGYIPDASSLLRGLIGYQSDLLQRSQLATDTEDIFYSRLILAGQCLAMRPTLQQAELREHIIKVLFEVLLHTVYTLTREQVAQVLVEIGGKEVHRRLFQLLANSEINPILRHSITEAMGKSRDETTIPYLLKLLQDPKVTTFVRRDIATALGKIGNQSVIPILLTLLTDQQCHGLVGRSIAITLGSLGDSTIISTLQDLLANQHIIVVTKQGIISALGEIGDENVINHLINLLCDSTVDSYVRQTIADTLGKYADQSAAPTLVKLFADPQTTIVIRQALAQTIFKLGNPAVLPELLGLLYNQNCSSSIRQYVAHILGHSGDQSHVKHLYTILLELRRKSQWDDILYSGIIDAMTRLGERRFLSEIIPLLSNKSIDVYLRRSMLKTLGETGDNHYVPLLIRLLDNRAITSLLREDIAETLSKLGDKSIVPPLLGLLISGTFDTGVSRKIVLSIERLADDIKTVETLTFFLKTSEIPDAIYQALWIISRRAGVRLCFEDANGLKNDKIHILTNKQNI